MEIIEFKTASGHTVYLRPYLTYGQKREIRKVLLKNIKFNPTTQAISEFGSDVLLEAQDMSLKMLIEKIVEVDGTEHVGDEILSAINNWKEEDGDALMDKVNEMTNLQEDKKKAK